MRIKEATAIAGSLGYPSKMPGTAYGISAMACKTGSKLAKIEGSVCHGCYALKANYLYPSVMTAHQKRMAGITHPEWVEAMVTLLSKSGEEYHRWHDSGDLQSLDHLKRIVEICIRTPSIKHWLPTREVKIVSDYVKQYGDFPSNLVVRVSSPMINDKPLTSYANTSTVHTDGSTVHGVECNARHNDNKCGDCRACWSRKVKNVSYPKH